MIKEEQLVQRNGKTISNNDLAQTFYENID